MTAEASTNCWVVHDGISGNRIQAIALCRAMGWQAREVLLKPTAMARIFSPYRFPTSHAAFGAAFYDAYYEIGATLPRFLIACGRQAALASRLLKRRHCVFSIQLLHPRINPKHWDVVISPAHDQLSGRNVIQCNGSLHDIDDAALQHWRSQLSSLQAMAHPRIAVFIGGPSRMASFDEGLIEVMFSHLEYALSQSGGSLMVCGSRRTPKAIAGKIRKRFAGSDVSVWFDERDGDNPYRALLANADRLVLTPDSVNMISEACATHVPVYIAQPERATGRMKIFMDHLISIKRIKALDSQMHPFAITPMNTMPDVIAQLKTFLPP
jgi:uncharacterized protein